MIQNNILIKANLMIFGLECDFFAYGTIVVKRKDGKYKVIADGERFYYTLHDLAHEWDQISDDQKTDIFNIWLEYQNK